MYMSSNTSDFIIRSFTVVHVREGEALTCDVIVAGFSDVIVAGLVNVIVAGFSDVIVAGLVTS